MCKLVLDSVHLLIVPDPKLAALDGLTLSHLSGPNDFVHEVAKQPDPGESQRYDHNQYGSQSRNAEEQLQLVAGRDDEECKIDDNEK